MMHKSAQSLMDVLIRLMPELSMLRKNKTDPKLANLLYNQIWSKENNRVSEKMFRRPAEVKQAEIDRLKGDGLVDVSGENITITEKGAGVIKSMILGDSRSVFDDDDSPLDYLKATASLKPSRLSKKAKQASADEPQSRGSNWYSKLSQRLSCESCCRPRR